MASPVLSLLAGVPVKVTGNTRWKTGDTVKLLLEWDGTSTPTKIGDSTVDPRFVVSMRHMDSTDYTTSFYISTVNNDEIGSRDLTFTVPPSVGGVDVNDGDTWFLKVVGWDHNVVGDDEKIGDAILTLTRDDTAPIGGDSPSDSTADLGVWDQIVVIVRTWGPVIAVILVALIAFATGASIKEVLILAVLAGIITWIMQTLFNFISGSATIFSENADTINVVLVAAGAGIGYLLKPIVGEFVD